MVMWTQLSDAERQSIVDEYHAAGIALMISVFGAEGELQLSVRH